MNNKKTRIAIISVVALLLVLIGVTYAYWLVTKTQTNSNIISSACLDITLDNESNDISLSSQYPMSDEEGMKLTPYTFKVTNNCNTSIDYQVALEAIGDEANAIASSAIKVALDNSSKLYSHYGEVSTTISGAYESRSIGYARLAASGKEGSSVTHSLRIWIDENAPISEANKTFQSKISVTIGQGIDSPYEEGTLAYDILANNGGAGVSVIDVTELEDRITSEGDVSVSISSNYYFGTEYTLDESTGTYQLSGTIIQATLAECRDGSKSCGKYTTRSTATSGTTLYEITDFQASGYNITAHTRKHTNKFGMGTVAREGGLYKTIDDLGESYYFRGDVSNNYVQFGKYAVESGITETIILGYTFAVYEFDEAGDVISWNENEMLPTLEACEDVRKSFVLPGENYDIDSECYAIEEDVGKDMYWRIVRINGDGTIRLVYDGVEKVTNGADHNATIESISPGDSFHDLSFVGSDVKEVLDSWYNAHLKTNYDGYVADGIFCEDSEVVDMKYYFWNDNDELIETTPDNAEVYDYYYAPAERVMVNKPIPQLTCTRLEDRHTKTTELGNGKLENPVGLLTADEVMFAGASAKANKTAYLYSGESFWTMSPSYDVGNIEEDMATFVSTNENLYITYNCVICSDGVRPVINLRADVEFTGNGSFETPYVIKTN